MHRDFVNVYIYMCKYKSEKEQVYIRGYVRSWCVSVFASACKWSVRADIASFRKYL